MADTPSLLRRADNARKPVGSANDVTPGHVPAIRKGEDATTSRPFSLLRMLGVMNGHIPKESAKVEMALVGNFKKALEDTRTVPAAGNSSSAYIIGSRDLLPDDIAFHESTRELHYSSAMIRKAVDPDEVMWMAAKLDSALVEKGYDAKFQKTAMSYLSDTTGGTLVAPPEMGEIIPLMRNQSAVDRAGARMIPLPPQGKWIAPRVTNPTTAYWVGENTSITQSNPTTGQVEMMAKKLACLTLVPNELFKYASVSADALLRTDIAKSLALGFDYACLYGTSGAQPKGLKFYTGTNEVLSYTASTTGTDGDTLNPQDGYRMASAIEDRNFDLAGWKWIMRPKFWGNIASFRASSGAVTTADQLGLFVQDLTRKLGDGAAPNWCGYPVVRSSQIPTNLTKGSGTTLTEVWGGCWSEAALQGMYGAVEFAQATQGDTMFAQDQTMVRGILHCDFAPRYSGAFARCTQLLNP